MFDIDQYLRITQRVKIDDLDWDAVPDHPLNDGERSFLHFAMNVEDHTIVYLKELLSTRVIRDPEVTAFLSCWAYEEYFHGEALERFLVAHDGPQAPGRDVDARFEREGRFKRGVKKVAMPFLSAASPDFSAVHMTWGATNELTTLNAYEQIARKSEHPVLKELLGRIVKDERRHFAFYYQQAQKRLEAHPRMQKINRFLMDRAWSPVGTTVHDPLQIDEVSNYAFGDDEGRKALAAANETIAQLPGMAGWRALEGQVLAGAERATRSTAVASGPLTG